MQNFNSTGGHSSALPRDGELQLRLADSAGPGEGRENGAGTHFLRQPEEPGSPCTKRRMLVGLDLLCLLVGECESGFYSLFQERITKCFPHKSALHG